MGGEVAVALGFLVAVAVGAGRRVAAAGGVFFPRGAAIAPAAAACSVPGAAAGAGSISVSTGAAAAVTAAPATGVAAAGTAERPDRFVRNRTKNAPEIRMVNPQMRGEGRFFIERFTFMAVR